MSLRPSGWETRQYLRSHWSYYPPRRFFSDQARDDYRRLEERPVPKTLALLEANPRHPSLHTHEYLSLTRAVGIKVFEAYAENRTPAAYRVFWCYGPQKDELTIIAITPHP